MQTVLQCFASVPIYSWRERERARERERERKESEKHQLVKLVHDLWRKCPNNAREGSCNKRGQQRHLENHRWSRRKASLFDLRWCASRHICWCIRHSYEACFPSPNAFKQYRYRVGRLSSPSSDSWTGAILNRSGRSITLSSLAMFAVDFVSWVKWCLQSRCDFEATQTVHGMWWHLYTFVKFEARVP